MSEEPRLHVGMALTITDESAPVTTVAPLLEDAGIESLWVGDHSHMPIHSRHKYTIDGRVPENYKHFLDPLITLTAAASVTTRLRLGTSVILAAERNPIHFAKEVASLDFLSRGRTTLGIGWGWNPLEAKHNRVQGNRRLALRETIDAASRLWHDEVAEFEGDHVSFGPSWAYPKPVQQPRPPVYLGALLNERALEEVVHHYDGWLPITQGRTLEDLADNLVVLRRREKEVGRSVPVRVTLLDTRTYPRPTTTIEEFESRLPSPAFLDNLVELGVERIVLSGPSNDLELLEGALERVETLQRHVA